MKGIKKILALAISVCLIIGAVPMFTASAETETLADISYSNSFDEGDTLKDLKDFYAYWGAGQDGSFSWQKDITSNISTTVSDTVGALGRKSIDESYEVPIPIRIWGHVYFHNEKRMMNKE